MNNLDWQERLQMLCNRFSHRGIGADLVALPLIELRSVYFFLSHFAYG